MSKFITKTVCMALMTALCLSNAGALFAQDSNSNCDDHIAGVVTDDPSNFVPIATMYNYSYSQQIYDATEIGSAGQITKISFQFPFATPKEFPNQVIYMANSAKSVFSGVTDWAPVSGLQQVFSGLVNYTNTETDHWVTIDLDTPFDYTGGNLIVAYVNNKGTGWFGGSSFDRSPAPGKSIVFYQDGGPVNLENPTSGGVFAAAQDKRANAKFEVCTSSSPPSGGCKPVSNLIAVYENDCDVLLTWNPPTRKGKASKAPAMMPMPEEFGISLRSSEVKISQHRGETPSYAPPNDWIKWCQHVPFGSVGVTSASGEADIIAMSRYTPADLATMNVMSDNFITKVQFVPWDVAAATFEIYIYQGGWGPSIPGTLMYQQPVTQPLMDGVYNEVVLTTPFIIDATQELWIGYRTITTSGHEPAGIDMGPPVLGKGDIICLNGNWTTLNTLLTPIPSNWNIEAFIEPGNPNIAAAPNPFSVTPVGTSLAADLAWTNPTETVGGDPLTSINSIVIKRDGIQIHEITGDITVGDQMTWQDTNVPMGQRCYTVHAVTDEGNGSRASDCAVIGDMCEAQVIISDVTYGNMFSWALIEDATGANIIGGGALAGGNYVTTGTFTGVFSGSATFRLWQHAVSGLPNNDVSLTVWLGGELIYSLTLVGIPYGYDKKIPLSCNVLYNVYIDDELIPEGTEIKVPFFTHLSDQFDASIPHTWSVRTVCEDGGESEPVATELSGCGCPAEIVVTSNFGDGFSWTLTDDATGTVLASGGFDSPSGGNAIKTVNVILPGDATFYLWHHDHTDNGATVTITVNGNVVVNLTLFYPHLIGSITEAVPCSSGPPEPCNPPTTLAVEYNNDCNATLTWDMPDGSENAIYNIYRDDTQIASNHTTTSYTDTGNNPAIGHIWSVTQVCGNDESESVSVNLEPLVIDAPVATAATDLGCDSFVANWNAVTGTEGYLLSVYTGSDYILEDFAVGSNVISYEVTGLTPGTTYAYYVKSVIICLTDISNEIEVTLPIYTITAIAGAGGSMTPGTVQVCGVDQTYTFAADNGYIIDQLFVDGEEVILAPNATTGSYTFENVMENHAIDVTFIPYYVITAIAGAGGTMSPLGTVIVNEGADQTFVITANGGYVIDQLLVDGEEIAIGASVTTMTYTFENVMENHTIAVTFKKFPSYIITAVAGINGAIDPSGKVIVNEGNDQTFTFWANSGYEISEVLIDGVNDPAAVAAGEYTFENVIQNHAIVVNFNPIPLAVYTIEATAGPNGAIMPDGLVSVVEGNDRIFAFKANKGYQVDEVFVDGNSIGAVANYTFANVSADHTIHVTFKEVESNLYTVFVTYGAGGTVSPNGLVYVATGTDQTFVITPLPGYKINQVLINDVNDPVAVATGLYTFTAGTNFPKNNTLTATFTYAGLTQYYIDASVTTVGGTISPSGKVMVEEGADQTFYINAQATYQVKEVLVDGISVGAVTEYTFEGVVANHVISAKFEKATYAIEASITTDGGTISPIGTTMVPYGGSQAYTITPQTGYLIDEVWIDKGTVNEFMDPKAVSSGKYTFSKVDAPHTIVASFKQRTFDIVSSAGAGGSIDPEGVTAVGYGNSQTYIITPSEGYMIKSVLVDGKNNAAAVVSGLYTFANVTAKHTIAATFVVGKSASATDNAETEITIFPNPTTGELKITCYRHCVLNLFQDLPQSPENDEIVGQARNDIQSIEIFDVMGRSVLVETRRAPSLQSQLSTLNSQLSTQINISHLPPGIYFMKIKTDDGMEVKKVVKQ